MSPQDGSCQQLRNCVYIKLCRKNCGLFFSGHGAYVALSGYIRSTAVTLQSLLSLRSVISFGSLDVWHTTRKPAGEGQFSGASIAAATCGFVTFYIQVVGFTVLYTHTIGVFFTVPG